MRVIAVCNQKGGVGKTTVALNLAACLAKRGKRVLAVDMDPQGNLAQGLGLEPSQDYPLSDALLYDAALLAAVQDTKWQGLSVAPSDGVMLETTEARLGERLSGPEALGAALGTIGDGEFDFTVIDCRPSLGALTMTALAAADLIIAPVQSASWALEGLADLWAAKLNMEAAEGAPAPFRPLRILVNKWSPRLAASAWLEQQLKPYRGELLATRIRRNEAINQAAIAQEPVIAFSRRSNGAKDFRALAAEVEAL